MPASWIEELAAGLKDQFGAKRGDELLKKYSKAFPAGYIDENTAAAAIDDIAYMELLTEQQPLELNLYLAQAAATYPLHLRLYKLGEQIPLTNILPSFENLDLRAYSERPYKISLDGNQCVWISDFNVVYTQPTIDIERAKPLFVEAAKKIYFRECENDGFNKLILSALLSYRDIVILRAYAKYLRQIGFRFTQPYIENALSSHPDIARDLITFFYLRHDPKQKPKPEQCDEVEKRILLALESVPSLDEDYIFRRLLAVMKATLRVNFFQLDKNKQHKPYFSFKLNSKEVPELPLPCPLYEIFVYSPNFEAIHLRNSKVARGGMRWSDRREDFRTEILGLMKAQNVKNAVIVPSGAKGGFVLKAILPPGDREALLMEVVQCYKSFIRGMLDLTDNKVGASIVRPPQVVCYDDEDPYLVVAADKGTATFSDIANDISKEYGFWLDDAFASGGSTGYDHKEMGITAKGAWESIKRHFREKDIDVMETTITVVGIGDMSGDVFGNGLLYSNKLKLVGAFDHRDIFIDPDPDPAVSYEERARLFKLPISSWQDYNPTLISKGGGVFKRSLKSITITPEMQRVFGIEANALTPNELMRALLKAPVDLLYNGGIGTYVKSSAQSNADVGDRTNDYCRVNGNELRCQVVGEGGNLGFTQLGRIEYALTGGLINTDFIDNSAGVDCSDHEVNIKILLDHQIHEGKLNYTKRNETLASLTDEVAELVLKDNYHQALVMSFTAHHAKRNLTLHQNYIKDLESTGALNRELEFLPDDKTILERKSEGLGLTRPELAVLLAYSKIHIKAEILKSNLTEDPYLRHFVTSAFPPALTKKYANAMDHHSLSKEIIATQLSNYLVNEMGFTYVYRAQVEIGATIEEIIRAFIVSSEIFGTVQLQKSVQELDFKVSMPEQYEMLFNIRNLLNLATRWFLHSTYLKTDLKTLIEQFQPRVEALEKVIPTLMGGFTRDYYKSLVDKFKSAGLSLDLAERIGTYRAMYTSLNIIDVACTNHFDLIKTAKVYFAAGESINLVWFRDQIASDAREGHWNILARLTLREELDICQRALTIAVLKSNGKDVGTVKLIENWMEKNPRIAQRWDNIQALLHNSSQIEYSMFFIALRELLGLIVASQG